MENSLNSTTSSSSGNGGTLRLNHTRNIMYYINSDDTLENMKFFIDLIKTNPRFDDHQVYEAAIRCNKIQHLAILISAKRMNKKGNYKTNYIKTPPFEHTVLMRSIEEKNDLAFIMLLYLTEENYLSPATQVDNLSPISLSILNNRILCVLILLGHGIGPISVSAKEFINNSKSLIDPKILYLIENLHNYLMPYRDEFNSIVFSTECTVEDLRLNILEIPTTDECLKHAGGIFKTCEELLKNQLENLSNRITQKISSDMVIDDGIQSNNNHLVNQNRILTIC